MELRKDLEAATGLELPPMLAFDYPTPEALAGCIMDLCPLPPLPQSIKPQLTQSAEQAAGTAHTAGSAGIAGGPAAGESAAETGADWERVGGDQRRVIVLQQVAPFLQQTTRLTRLDSYLNASETINSEYSCLYVSGYWV